MSQSASVLGIEANTSQRHAADPAASVWVSASAGTGKTKVLTDRVLSLLVTGSEPQKLLCLTFTRAAAAEMETRVAGRLGAWTMLDDDVLVADLSDLLGYTPDAVQLRTARQLFAKVLDTPGGMNIQTIHAFCQSVLRRFPLEAGMAPHFRLMDERDADEMLVQAREVVLAQARTGGDDTLAAALAEVTRHLHELAFPTLLASLTADRGRLRRLLDSHGGVDPLIEVIFEHLGVAPGTTPEALLVEASDPTSYDQIGLKLAAEALMNSSDRDAERGRMIDAWTLPVATSAPDFDSYAGVYLTAKRHSGSIEIRKTLMTKKTAEAFPGSLQVLEVEAARIARTLLTVRAATTANSTAALLRFAEALLDSYQRQKEDRALIDYDDLILETAHLLKRPGVAPWVLFKLDGGIDHILIDEAQDTSPEQWRVVEALADEFFAGEGTQENSRTVFAVGDVKQSIYSFQGADPKSFQAMRDEFAARIPAAHGQWREVDLNVSFRSTLAVLSAVDGVFAASAAADGVTLDGSVIEHYANRDGDGGIVEIWPAVEPREIDAPIAWKPPVERIQGDSPPVRLAQLIAGRIKRMVGLEMLEAKGRPVRPGDIMILVRRRGPIVEELVRALKNQDIAVAGVDRMVLTEQIAVMDLIALGRVLLLPEDELTLATVLKGPIIGLSEEQLFDLAHGREGRLWQALSGHRGQSSPFGDAHGLLSELLALADRMPPFELFSEILGARGGRQKLLARLGADAEDPISEFLDLALSFEDSHTPTLEGFLYWMESGGVEVKRDLEQASQDAVRVMTVHGAKGLQAPIIFLPDTLQTPTRLPPLLWPSDGGGEDQAILWPPRRAHYEAVAEAERTKLVDDRDREYRRLLYVAMTRAEDRLYICGWQTKKAAPDGCWYQLIEDGLRPLAEEVDDPYLAEAGETAGSQILRLVSPQITPVDHQADDAYFETAGLPGWATAPPPDEPAPPTPLAPSQPSEPDPAVMSPLSGDDGYRFRRGNIIHALLQSLPDLNPAAWDAAARRYLASEVHDLAQVAQEEIAAETLAVLNHPDHQRLFGPGSKAEVPLVGQVNGQVISAQIDRLMVGDSDVTIVDYKTNRPPPADSANVPLAYLRQMAAYRAALSAVYPGRAIHCLLLWTDGPSIMALDQALLEGHAP